jgi:hypothetical protein
MAALNAPGVFPRSFAGFRGPAGTVRYPQAARSAAACAPFTVICTGLLAPSTASGTADHLTKILNLN